MTGLKNEKQVCDGCWRVGRCHRPASCRCPCFREGWRHADDPRNLQEARTSVVRPYNPEVDCHPFCRLWRQWFPHRSDA